MQLKNLDFGGYVFGQSGVQGFFGEGQEYRHHALYKFIPGFSFEGMSFVAKTVTLPPRVYGVSNTRLSKDGFSVKDFFPASIWCSVTSFIKGYMVNAVGLANPGLRKMLTYEKWQCRRDVFQVSISLEAETLEGKIAEIRQICSLFKNFMMFDQAHRYAIQLNLSCPNSGQKQLQEQQDLVVILKTFTEEMPEVLLIPKFALSVEPSTLSTLRPYCDAFCIGNTIPFGQMKDQIKWNELFKDGISPLVKRIFKALKKIDIKGGLSGAPLFPVLINLMAQLQRHDPELVIIAGGGILKKEHIKRLSEFDIVKGVALGSVAILRPWRMRSLIKYGNQVFKFR